MAVAADAVVENAGLKAINNIEEVETATARATELTEEQLANLATEAAKLVGKGKGGVHGTHVHTGFEKLIKGLGLENVATEVSFKGKAMVRRGEPGSVRVDVIVYMMTREASSRSTI